MAELRLATRGSALALAQAEGVARSLRECGHEVELVVAESAANPAPGQPGGDKERFVRAVQNAVLSGRADLGVHSAKDLPYAVPAELGLAAVPPRERARDAWIVRSGEQADRRADTSGASLGAVPGGIRVGTASLRRRSQLLALRPDLDVLELRGNVDTRLARLEAGDFDAVILATAGLHRLGLEREIGFEIPEAEMLPAAGQGALALESRLDDAETAAAVTEISDATALRELTCERALIGALEADCDSPVGAHCTHEDGGLAIDAYVGTADGTDFVRDRLLGELSEPERLGAAAGERLLAAGAGAILGRT